MVLFIIRAYASAIRAGNKYTFQTIPRLITLWLDIGEDSQLSQNDQFSTINSEVLAAVQTTPSTKYASLKLTRCPSLTLLAQWLSAFPQIISRVDHKSKIAYDVLALLISSVLQEYPQQALWQFISVVKSRNQSEKKEDERYSRS